MPPACLYRAPASGPGSRSESYKWSCLLPRHKLAVPTQQQQASAHGMRVTHATCPYSSYASCYMLTNNSCTPWCKRFGIERCHDQSMDWHVAAMASTRPQRPATHSSSHTASHIERQHVLPCCSMPHNNTNNNTPSRPGERVQWQMGYERGCLHE